MSDSGDDLREPRIVRHGNLAQENKSRREFLQATAATFGAFLLPWGLRESADDESHWFLHAVTGNSWLVADPVAWSLDNALQPTLVRASVGLRKLSTADGERVIRLVTRRCALNLIELHPGRVVVHHWGRQGLADLRAFFKDKGLARREVEVVVLDRKREEYSTQAGDDYLFGEALAPDFPLGLLIARWRRRFERDSDDWSAAPGTWSGYAREGIEDNRIPWAALKSAWRRTHPLTCPNCDRPTVLTNFGWPFVGMCNRSPRFVRVCCRCRRLFKDNSVTDVRAWLLTNLDAEVRPEFEMIWDRRKLFKPAEMLPPLDEPGS